MNECKAYCVFCRYAYDHYGGGMTWSDIIKPTIDMAEDGVQLGDQLAQVVRREKELVMSSKELCDLFCNDDRNDVKNSTDIYLNNKLVQLLREIQVHGVDDFYR